MNFLTGYNYKLDGNISEGFEPVKKEFGEYFRNGKESRGQLCVYVGDEKVVDLYGSIYENDDFGPSNLIPIFSAGKMLTSILIGVLVDKKILDYNQKISQIWPEFAKNGKKEGTVADLLRHEIGIPFLKDTLIATDCSVEKIKENKIGAMLEDETYHFPPGEKGEPHKFYREAPCQRDYHLLSRGLIANEIVRRADPKGRTIGELLRLHVSDPLGASVYIGMTEEECKLAPPVEYLNPLRFLMKSFTTSLSSKLDVTLFSIISGIFTKIKNGEKLPPAPLMGFSPMRLAETFGVGEIPSGNAYGNARGLAAIGAAMANRGVFKGKKVLSEEGWSALHGNVKKGDLWGISSYITEGGINVFDDDEKVKGWYGFMGLGGSVFHWHPEHRISFVFLPTYLDWTDFSMARGVKIRDIVYDCVMNMKKNSKS